MKLKIKIKWIVFLSLVAVFLFYISYIAIKSAIEVYDSERTAITMTCFIELNEGSAIPAYVRLYDNFNKPDRSSLSIETKYGYASNRGFNVPFEENYYSDKPNLTTDNNKKSYLTWLLTVKNISLKNKLDTDMWVFTGEVMFQGYEKVPYRMACGTSGKTIEREHQSWTFSETLSNEIFGRSFR